VPLTVLTDTVNIGAVIRSFRCQDTERLFHREPVRRFKAFESVARRKLEMLDAAHRLEDLKVPPGNRLEALSGDRKGQHSIRINDQWRLCFVWRDGGADNVEIVDYH
jgi:proteic killer suppression protein